MLSRIASSVFWMGRYIERSEHLARYSRDQFFSMADAPHVLDKRMALRSILHMSASTELYFKKYEELTSSQVFDFSVCDEENVSSIFYNIKMARENARSARYKIPAEAWEALNKHYHFISGCLNKKFRYEQRYDLYQNIINNTYITKGFLANSLLRDEAWLIINTASHLEKAIQVNRMILAKLQDFGQYSHLQFAKPVENYLWGSLLRSTDSLDIVRRVYRAEINQEVVIRFLLLNRNFPKSVLANVISVNRSLSLLNPYKSVSQNTAEYLAGKLEAQLKFMSNKELQDRMREKQMPFLWDLLKQLNTIGSLLEEQYLSY